MAGQGGPAVRPPPASTASSGTCTTPHACGAQPATTTKRRGPTSGVWAPPGVYTVELTVGGHSLRQPLEVRPDPQG